jgi:hypothetical protein
MTKLTAQIPAHGIMQTSEYNEAKSYRIGCDCHSTEHDVHMWIEVEGDTECQDVQVGFFADMTTPVWDKNFNRIKAAWNILVYGYQRQEHHLILKKQTAINLAGTIEKVIKELEPSKNV